jgi:endonuclease YncB( thermonuclease family)
MKRLTLWTTLVAALLTAPTGSVRAQTESVEDQAQPVSLVRMNGVVYPVYYNDGDTYRPLAGPWRSRPARLAGFNTLESYGPTHKWGEWTYKELYINAKMATYNARRSIWNCKVDDAKKDGYGRILAVCLDLGIDQVRKGYAHAYSIDKPADWRLITAQRAAIVNRRGMWAKGVPPMVLTSLHSVDERINNENNYNRLISPFDGLSSKWKHQDNYSECQEVCHMGKVADKKAKLAVIAALRADPSTSEVVKGYEDPYLMAMFDEYTTTDRVPQIFTRKGHIPVKKKLDRLLKDGTFGKLKEIKGSCMVYATFERRYIIKPKPKCLKW